MPQQWPQRLARLDDDGSAVRPSASARNNLPCQMCCGMLAAGSVVFAAITFTSLNLTPLAAPPVQVLPHGSRAPLAVATSGGGFRAMAGSMGIGRALGERGLWPAVTHLSSNSGGGWFASQLVFSEWFYHNVAVNTSWPIGEVVAEWGRQYDEAISPLVTMTQQGSTPVECPGQPTDS